jgi:hypothetical protein
MTQAAEKSLRLYGGPGAENALRKFVMDSVALKSKIHAVAEREEAFMGQNRDFDLRDAVSDSGSADSMRRELARATSKERAKLLQKMPGLKSPKASLCRTLADCPHPELAMDVSSADTLPEELRRLVRPWMLLQEARGSDLELIPVTAAGDAVLTLKLKDLKQELTLNVSPRLFGGFKVWFEQPLVLASLYGRERDALMKSPR